MTSVESTNIQQVAVEDDSEDGITLMDLMRVIRKHLVTAAIVFVMVFRRGDCVHLLGSAEVYRHGSGYGYVQCIPGG